MRFKKLQRNCPPTLPTDTDTRGRVRSLKGKGYGLELCWQLTQPRLLLLHTAQHRKFVFFLSDTMCTLRFPVYIDLLVHISTFLGTI